MKKIDKIKIEDKLLNLKEKTQLQALELHNEIKKKNERVKDILNDNTSSNVDILSSFSGIHAFAIIFNAIRRDKAIKELKINSNILNLIENKNYEVNKLHQLVTERLNIIEKAETNDLKDFLEKNDAYSIFKDGSLEKFMTEQKKETDFNMKTIEGITNER